MIMRTLQKTKNNKTRAAELLGISLKTLHNKLNLYRERGLLNERVVLSFCSSSMALESVNAAIRIPSTAFTTPHHSQFFKTKIPRSFSMELSFRPIREWVWKADRKALPDKHDSDRRQRAAELGYHKQGFPNKPLLEILQRSLNLSTTEDAGVGPITFANAYTSWFFDERPRWVSATTAAVEAAGMNFRTVADLKNDNAVYQDFTNRMLIKRGESVSETKRCGGRDCACADCC